MHGTVLQYSLLNNTIQNRYEKELPILVTLFFFSFVLFYTKKEDILERLPFLLMREISVSYILGY
ncbi:hypothetical protein DCPSUM001_36540 [Dysgonomonas capnocytophagoides]|nr:hypothetical protein DCPSUM001_36540 [Dysgonomonas capnocytophagoides]